jgi:hypothetical protein
MTNFNPFETICCDELPIPITEELTKEELDEIRNG